MTLSICLSIFILGTGFQAKAQVSGPQAIADEYIIKMKSKSGESANGRLSAGMKIISKMGPRMQIKQAFWGSHMMHIKSGDAALIESLKSNPDVDFVEPNFMLSVDPVDIQPFGVSPDSNDYYDQSGANVHVTDSWDIQKPYNQGSKTVVAVIDTGLDTNHGLFRDANAIWSNAAEVNGLTGVDDDGNGYVDDVNGWNYVSGSGNVYDDDDHGTHVAGIILGVGQDILAFPVRESKIKIMPLKFLDGSGSGTTANAVNAIYYAVNMGARVINNSWGGSAYSKSLHEAYAYAYGRGVVIATAAGNSGSNNDSTPMYPSSLDTPNNISVAATTDSDNKASFSNYGSAAVTVGAPGVAIISTVPGLGCQSPGCYQMMSGTSMASPFVAGIAALVLREAPQLSAYQVRTIILSSVDVYNSLNNKVSTSGRVNVLKAIQAAQAQVATASYTPSYSPVYKADRSVASTPEAPAAAGCGLVKTIIESSSGGGGSASSPLTQSLIIVVMVLMPMVLALGLRNRTAVTSNSLSGAQRRKYARYNLAKAMTFQVGDQVVSSETDTVSLGGLSFSSDLKVQKGEKIKIKLGEMQQEIEGEVVWCSDKQSYGVKFLEISDQLQSHMNQWTSGLTPT